MATYSELMKLKLPAKTDKYNIEDFNGNFTAIDTKIKGVENSIAASVTTLNTSIAASASTLNSALTTKTSKLQTQIDRLRYNEYVQFVREHYSNTPYNALGYFCDIMANYEKVEGKLADDGILIEGSAMKMGSSYEYTTMGRNMNTFVNITKSAPYISVDFECTKNGSFLVALGILYRQNGGGSSFSMQSQGDYFFSITSPIGVWAETICAKYCNFTSGTASTAIMARLEYTEPNMNVGADTAVSGNYYLNGISQTGLPVGFYGVKCLDLLTTSYISKEQTANAAFDEASLYIRYNAPSGTSVLPYISVSNGSTWIPFSLSSTKDTVNNAALPCKEGKYTIPILTRGTKFKIKLEMRRNAVSQTPEIYDYCLMYGEK